MEVTYWHFFVALILVFGFFLRKVLRWFVHVLRGRVEKYPFVEEKESLFSNFCEVVCGC